MKKNIHGQIIAETKQGADTRKHLFTPIEKHLENRTLVSFFTTFSLPVSISHEDANMIESILKQLDLSKGLALLINSPGGDPIAAERIINVCKAYSGTKDYWAIVAGRAKSAATMVCMGASKIFMSLSAELGPVDPQVRVKMQDRDMLVSAHNIVSSYEELFSEAVKTKGRLEPYIQQLNNYDHREVKQFKAAIDLSEDIAVKILKGGTMAGVSAAKIKKQIKIFLDPTAGTLTHGRPIFVNEAQNCGINVEEIDMKSAFWNSLYELYVRTDRFVSQQALKAVESKEEAFLVSIPT